MVKEGLVLKSTGSWYLLKNRDGEYVEARLKGKIRLKGLKSTNPIAVGDWVQYEPDTETIKDLIPRKNYLIRRSNNLSKYSHIIAANIDQAILLISYKNPRTSLGFIDRFLLTCEAYSIPVTIVLNKLDTLSEAEKTEVSEQLAIYSNIDYPIMQISAKEQENWEALLTLLNGKVSLIAGHSGVGKSTLINQLIPDVDLKVGDISEVNFKGKHTTTFAEMHALNDESYIIDTPGIKDFGLVNMEREEISHYFREMAPLLEQCKFSNCLHLHEPKCAVIEAVAKGEIAETRYDNYIQILEGDEEVNNPDYLWRKTL